MATRTFHIVPHDERWAVKREGNERSSSIHDTQKEAIDSARGFACDGDSLVIHRPDGTIREKVTYNEVNGEANNANGDRVRKPQPYEIMSVGTRVSWGAVLAGAVVAVAVYCALSMLAIAVGVTTIDDMQIRAFAITGLVVVVFNILVSLFIGGFVVSRTTVGENKMESLMYGLLLWGMLFAFVLTTGAGAGFGLGFLATNTETSRVEAIASADLTEKVGLTQEQQQKYKEVVQEARQVTDDVNPTAMAWIGFGGMILSIFASIAGAVCGAGPELVIKQMRGRRMAVVKTA